MPDFNYVGLNNETGKQVKGTVAADNEAEALDKIKAKGLTPMSVEEATAMTKSVSIGFGTAKPKPRDMSVFCRQMVSVLSAGVSMSKALEMLGQQTENKTLQTAIVGCQQKIEAGSSMHEAMEDYKCMSGIFATMIAAGEESGSLETSFTRMAEKFEKDAKLKALVKKSTMYPMVLGIILVVVVVVMLEFIIPKFTDFLGQLGTDLPAITKAIVNASEFFKKNIVLIAIAVGGLIVGVKMFKKSSVGRHFIDNIMLKAPLLGTLTKKTACSNVARTLATLVSTGISILDALDITAATMTNIFFKEGLEKVKVEVAQGMPLSEALEMTKLFPPMITQMTKIGEETGQLVEMFDRAANYFDEEVEAATQSVTAAIEPMVIVAMAGIVGTMVIALLMPMMSMYDGLDSM